MLKAVSSIKYLTPTHQQRNSSGGISNASSPWVVPSFPLPHPGSQPPFLADRYEPPEAVWWTKILKKYWINIDLLNQPSLARSPSGVCQILHRSIVEGRVSHTLCLPSRWTDPAAPLCWTVHLRSPPPQLRGHFSWPENISHFTSHFLQQSLRISDTLIDSEKPRE